jgi:predicted AlkP superfamily pyrophosphatase or phosphodiesterase
MKKLRVIMLDAFKPQYLKHAPYLSSLTKKFQGGELEMPVGHEGGVEIIFNRESDKLALFYKEENSSLKFVKHFLFLEKFGNKGRFILDCMINLPRFLRGYELFRTGKIPMKELWKVDFSVKKPLNKSARVKFKYFGELDKVGHEFGTKGKEIISAIKNLDKKISKMDFDLIFSDHGMIDVEKTISMPWTKNCFIDSDMARYWGEKEELEKIKKKLPLKDGKILDWDNEEYGQLIFVVNPGILILPNFWQGNEKVKAMHGYFGKHEEMNGIYILRKKGDKKNIKAFELHQILQEIQNGK